jgi:hypothetical protein
VVDAVADEGDEPLLEQQVRAPQLLVRHPADALRPEFGVALALLPVLRDILLVEVAYERRDPRRRVHTVGDRSDRDFVGAAAGEGFEPQRARDLAVLAADAVRRAAHLQSQRRQAEQLALVAARDAAEVEELLVRKRERRDEVAPQAVLDQFGHELVVAGGDRRVRREHAARADDGGCFLKRAAGDDHFAREFEREEGRVAFVQVVDVRRDVERAQQPDAADAEDDLLHAARLAVAAVEVAGDEAVGLAVLRKVRVEQVEFDAAHFGQPRAQFDRAAAHLHPQPQRLVRRAIEHGAERQVFGIDLAVVLFL